MKVTLDESNMILPYCFSGKAISFRPDDAVRLKGNINVCTKFNGNSFNRYFCLKQSGGLIHGQADVAIPKGTLLALLTLPINNLIIIILIIPSS